MSLGDVSIGLLKVVLVVHTSPVSHTVAGVRRAEHTVEAEAPTGVNSIVLAWCDDEDGFDPVAVTGDPHVVGYRVEERVQWDLGPPPPARTRISFVRRRPSLTREQFADHWANVHAPLARRHHPGLWRYVQNIVISPLTPDAPEVDGIAELGFRTADDLRDRMYDSPDGMRVIRDDVGRFIDVGAGWRAVTRSSSPRASP
jgi:uncharacterized protein (TIGR02118 family)